jgi:hypothetical protein
MPDTGEMRYPSWLVPVVVLLGALFLATLARYRLVEPADLTALCDAAVWESPICVLRTVVIESFAAQRLGIAALVFSVLAVLTRQRAIALLALAIASAGLVLYSTDRAAPAALLAALALLPPTSSGGAR